MGLLLAVALGACHKEEQAVVGVAQNAVNAERKAQAAATERDSQRAALAPIPLPAKSMYVDVHEPGAWVNPFLSVDADTLNLRITLADANPSTVGQGTMLRPGRPPPGDSVAPRRPGPGSHRPAHRRMALWPRHRRRRVAAGRQKGPPQGPPQRGSRHSAAQRPGGGCRRVARPVAVCRDAPDNPP